MVRICVQHQSAVPGTRVAEALDGCVYPAGELLQGRIVGYYYRTRYGRRPGFGVRNRDELAGQWEPEEEENEKSLHVITPALRLAGRSVRRGDTKDSDIVLS